MHSTCHACFLSFTRIHNYQFYTPYQYSTPIHIYSLTISVPTVMKHKLIQGSHSISKMKLPDFHSLCLALLPDPSEVQVLVLCNFLVGSSSHTPTPFHHHFDIHVTYIDCVFSFFQQEQTTVMQLG